MKSWKKISEEKLLEHSRLTVVEDTVELPDGSITKYLRFKDQPNATSVIAVNADGKILLQKEYSYPPNEWLFQFPGGALDAGETPHEGAARELAEEAGLAGELLQIGWFYIDNRRKDTKFFIFTATNLQDVTRNPDPEEAFEDYWFTEDEIDTMISSSKITNYSTLASWALYRGSKRS